MTTRGNNMLRNVSLLFLLAIVGSCNETGLSPELPQQEPGTPSSEIIVDSSESSSTVELNMPVAIAEASNIVRPLDWVTLDGTQSYDPDGFYPLQYEWSVVSIPDGSTTQLDDVTSSGPQFWADLAGDYTFELVVTNTQQKISEPDLITITAEPAQSFYVQLSWDSISDLDLHLQNGVGVLYGIPNDCNWCNLNPEWGLPGPLDNPSLDYDTIDGYGPETTTIDEPYGDTYTVSVVYYGMDGFPFCTTWTCPPTLATVRLFVDGEEAYVWSRMMYEAKDVWVVAEIDWPSLAVNEVNLMSITLRNGCTF